MYTFSSNQANVQLQDDSKASQHGVKSAANSSGSEVVINQLTPDITTFSAPFRRSGLAEIGIRMSAIKLPSSDLIIYNPIDPSPQIQQTLNSLGRVSHVVLPNIVHHIHLEKFMETYPQATILGPEGMAAKHKKWQNQIVELKKGDSKLNRGEKCLWDNNLVDFSYFPGFGNKEIWIFHRPSGALFLADMLYNLPATEQYSAANPEHKKSFEEKGFLQQKVDKNMNPDTNWVTNMQWALNKNDEELRGGLEKAINQWKPQIIVPEHGDVIKEGALEKLKKVFNWAFEKK
jgi:hypothetical protein